MSLQQSQWAIPLGRPFISWRWHQLETCQGILLFHENICYENKKDSLVKPLLKCSAFQEWHEIDFYVHWIELYYYGTDAHGLCSGI